MHGNEPSRIVVQERDKHLLRELAVMRVIDRELAKVVAGFRSTTRANARLLALLLAGLLRRFFLGTTAGGKKALYTLSAKGARLIGASDRGLQYRNDELLVANFFVAHQLAINEVYCRAKYRLTILGNATFVYWASFSEAVAPGMPLIPDGYFEVSVPNTTLAAFLEVDLGTEGAAVWKEKVRKYLRYAASGKFEERFHESQFRVLVVANAERRMRSIRTVVRGLTEKIFWFSTLEAIQRNGVWAPVWLRPADDTLRSLI